MAKQQSSTPPAQRKRRRWPWVILAVLVILVIFVALVPTLLSTGAGRRLALGQVNRQLNGRVTAEDWSLGWFSGVRMRNVTVLDEHGETVAQVASLTAPSALIRYLGHTKRLGTIEIVEPSANIIVYPDGTTNLQRLAKEPSKPRPERPDEPLGMDVQGEVIVRDGQARVQTSDGAPPLIVRSLNVHANIDSLSKPIPFEVQAALGEEKAPFGVKGAATPMRDGLITSDTIQADVDLSLSGLELAPVMEIARQFGVPLNATGLLHAQMQAQMEGTNHAQARGAVRVRGITLSGEALGEDRPAFEEVALTFDAAREGETVRVAQFALESPFLQANASGTVLLPEEGAPLPAGDLKSTARLNLAALAGQMPRTLRLHEGMEITGGTLSFQTRITSENNAGRVRSDIRIEGLAASRNGQPIALDEPVLLHVDVSQNGQGLRLNALELTSSFARAQGAGDMRVFNLNVALNLSAAIREAQKFLDLGIRQAAGTATLAVRLTIPGEARRQVEMNAQIEGLNIEGLGPEPARLARVDFTARATAELGEDDAVSRLSDVEATLRSVPAEMDLAIPELALVKDKALPVTFAEGRLALRAQLEELAALARGLGRMPEGMNAAGRMEMTVPMAVEGEVVRAPRFEMALRELNVTHGGKHLREPEILLSGNALVRPATRAAMLDSVLLQLSSGRVEIASAQIADWATLPQGFSADMRGQFSIEGLLNTLREFVPLPQGTSVSGQARFAVNASSLETLTRIAVNSSLAELRVARPEMPPLVEEEMTARAVVSLDMNKSALTLDSANVASSLLNLEAKGQLVELTAAQRLKADGTLEVNFDRLSPFVAALSGQPIELTGHQARPFSVETALGQESPSEVLRATLAHAGLYLGGARFMGIETGAIDILFRVRDGVGATRIETTANGGKVFVPLVVRVVEETPTLGMPPETPVLTDVGITDAMANMALARVNPLFKDAVISSGRVSLLMNRLSLPLDAEQARVKGTAQAQLALADVALRPSGVLATILGLMRVGEGAAVQLPTQRIGVALRDGRIHQDPIEFQAGGYALRIGGSVGLDMTLDMSAQVPVTAEMVGRNREVYAALQNETITVPIRGTATHPTLDAAAFRSSIATMMERAARRALRERGEEAIQRGLEDLLRRR